MCELFAMSARVPASVRFSFAEFSRHGGETAPHADGWGVAYREGRDARVLREPAPASESACVRFLQSYPLRSSLVLSHIRRATRGAVALENTQPFARELGGRLHLFAHNGDLPNVERIGGLGPAMPLGDTDSEHAFCGLLARLAPIWRSASGAPPSLVDRLGVLAPWAQELRVLGPANFVYSDGEMLFAHADRRKQRSGEITPPGLWLLRRTCSVEPDHASGVSIASESGPQEVALVASVPLSREHWQPLAPGELLAIERGVVVTRAPTE